MTVTGRFDQIDTARLTLRRLRLDDAPALAAVMGDWDVVRMTGTWSHPVDAAYVRRRIEERLDQPGFYALVLLGDDPVGMAHVAEGAIGYLLAKDHWGRGYATEVAAALVAHGFSVQDAPFLTAKVWADNPASSRVLEKLGFREVGRHTAVNRARGENLGGIDYRLERP